MCAELYLVCRDLDIYNSVPDAQWCMCAELELCRDSCDSMLDSDAQWCVCVCAKLYSA